MDEPAAGCWTGVADRQRLTPPRLTLRPETKTTRTLRPAWTSLWPMDGPGAGSWTGVADRQRLTRPRLTLRSRSDLRQRPPELRLHALSARLDKSVTNGWTSGGELDRCRQAHSPLTLRPDTKTAWAKTTRTLRPPGQVCDRRMDQPAAECWTGVADRQRLTPPRLTLRSLSAHTQT